MNALTQNLTRNLREYGMMAALVVIVVVFQVLTDGKMLIPNNIASLVQQNAYVFILTIGMVMVIVAGHIDLSVGSVVAFVGGLIGYLMITEGLPWPLVVVIAVAIGALVGCWQGFWVAYVGIPAFIVTLAGMLIFRGLAIVIAGTTISGFPDGFNQISKGSLPNFLGFAGNLDVVTVVIGALAIVGLVVAGLRQRATLHREGLSTESLVGFVIKTVIISALIAYITYLLANSAGGTPIVLVIVGVLVLVYTFVMNKTVFGRHIYAIGGNLHAAVLSGVNTKRVNFMIFVNMGLLAGIAGVVTTARAGASVASAGVNFELDAIAAAFIGGTAVTGGIGKVSGAIIGALIMGVLNMGLSIMGVDAAWQQSIKGLVLLAAVAFDILNKRKSGGH
ncbi:putative multiple sugar transport system permease protein [Flavimobilis soli]|uniref:Xylose transport system permease protein XylH n=1 Tax=Flavimobilis soli TaxID=442709 RepID=A0A2A9EEH7_9MICO|nr:multiple monosaccharide ABC transporter permease [Flavimobilis soli]PFG37324.1 putative multiple sugar transport system permease protein [Flavimobilis soli]